MQEGACNGTNTSAPLRRSKQQINVFNWAHMDLYKYSGKLTKTKRFTKITFQVVVIILYVGEKQVVYVFHNYFR
jgi:hypothetical protein